MQLIYGYDKIRFDSTRTNASTAASMFIHVLHHYSASELGTVARETLQTAMIVDGVGGIAECRCSPAHLMKYDWQPLPTREMNVRRQKQYR